jgi:hypothetical protein
MIHGHIGLSLGFGEQDKHAQPGNFKLLFTLFVLSLLGSFFPSVPLFCYSHNPRQAISNHFPLFVLSLLGNIPRTLPFLFRYSHYCLIWFRGFIEATQ